MSERAKLKMDRLYELRIPKIVWSETQGDKRDPASGVEEALDGGTRFADDVQSVQVAAVTMQGSDFDV